MERSISQGRREPRAPGATGTAASRRTDERILVAVGLGIVLGVLLIYAVSHPDRRNFYNHFVWQASAWLEGEAGIRYPVLATSDSPGNDYFQDVLPIVGPNGETTGRGLIPFPPLPAVVLLPFVALFGLATNAQLIATVLGALDVGLAFWMLGRLPIRPSVRIATTLFFGLGTVFWYAAQLGTTWYLAHVVAVGLTLVAIALALEADPRSVDDEPEPGGAGDESPEATDDARRGRAGRGRWLDGPLVDRRQFLAGLLFGLAATARLTVIFGAPFFVLVGGGRGWFRRGLSAGLGAAIPVLGLLAYNVATTGDVFHPAYGYLYELEAGFYTFLGYRLDWAIEDLRYIPQNLGIMLLRLPDILPACPPNAARGLFDPACPWVVPQQIGMSILLTSPAWLLGVPALRAYGRSRAVTGAAVAVVFIAVVNLMHFSQGWVQFGYRFSNDFAPFALILVALGLERTGAVRRVAVALVAVSIAVNAWGVVWGNVLGW